MQVYCRLDAGPVHNWGVVDTVVKGLICLCCY